MSHEALMRCCLALARRGQGGVGNGAMVGAVLVRDGTIIAEGWHERFSGPHAERVLLDRFDQKIRSSDALTLNLEPCCHEGKTPPCTNLIIERGIKRVVVGMEDPDLRVRGKGIALLRQHGVDVVGPVLPELCERLNRGFVSVRRQGRPWITLKKAQTKDGKIAKEDRSPLVITSHDQDIWSHTFLRACHDAILVGVSTVITDDPRLDCRFALGREQAPFQPWRVILDPQLRTPLTARVVKLRGGKPPRLPLSGTCPSTPLRQAQCRSGYPSPDAAAERPRFSRRVTDGAARRTIIIAADADIGRKQTLSAQGPRIMHVEHRGETFDWNDLWRVLTTPTGDFPGITSILVEGGAQTWELFQHAGMVDEEVTLVGHA